MRSLDASLRAAFRSTVLDNCSGPDNKPVTESTDDSVGGRPSTMARVLYASRRSCSEEFNDELFPQSEKELAWVADLHRHHRGKVFNAETPSSRPRR
jgi:hypothetical protein